MSDIRPTRLGKFELLARIAKGGMAEIYLARQHDRVGLSRLVVVKRILPHLVEEAPFVEMFLEEARLAALINHPNVVQIYDVGESEGDYYIAMEYIDGPSVGVLARRARKSKEPLPPHVAAELVAQACDGLHAAHELLDEAGVPLGLVHRDVSPHNLMLTRSGVVKLLDFGVAKAQDSTVRTNTGSIKGKFPYMSPEQCRGEPLDRRTDIFSLGVVFHELACAERLFQRTTDLMILKAITEDPIPTARDSNPALPEELSAVIGRSLAREREMRFDDAADFGQAVRGALAGMGERPSAKTLAKYIDDNYGDELERRGLILRDYARKPTGAHVPVIEGIETGSRGSASASLRGDRVPSFATQSAPTIAARPPRATAETPATRSHKRVWIWVAVVALVLGLGAGLVYRFLLGGPGRPSGPPILLAIPPTYRAGTLKKEFAPLLRYLERKLGRPMALVVSESYAGLRKQLFGGGVQAAFMSPLQLVRTRAERSDLDLLAASVHEGARSYQAYLIVRSGSAIENLAALRGKRICYVDRGSASGFLIARYFLRKNGIDPDRDLEQALFSGTHQDVLRDVLAGRCDVGATYSKAYQNTRRLGIRSSAIKILQVSGELPLDVIAASPKLAKPLRDALRDALLAFDARRDTGRPVLGDLYPISAFVPPRLADFAALEAADRSERALHSDNKKNKGDKKNKDTGPKR